MGGNNSKKPRNTDDSMADKTLSDKIEEELDKAREADMEIIKLLLLGAGESGKSTLFKQMVKLYGQGFKPKDLMLYIPMIHNNTLMAMKELCIQSQQLGEEYNVAKTDAVLEAFEAIVSEEVKETDTITAELAAHIKTLWADPGIKKTFHQRSRFQLMDTCCYFFDEIDRIGKKDFIPTDEDLIRCRVRTTGIVENHFEIDDNKFLMVDVGGQRNERKKWIHCFEGVTAVIFVAAISGYDQVLYEDGKTNRLDEALTLFSNTCASRWFSKTPFILFLNKDDLFREKIDEVPFTVWSKAEELGFDGDPHDYLEVISFITMLFEQRYHRDKLYVHVTCATNTENVHAVFGAVKDIIIQKHLGESGLMDQ